jgi:hypothetical protein
MTTNPRILTPIDRSCLSCSWFCKPYPLRSPFFSSSRLTDFPSPWCPANPSALGTLFDPSLPPYHSDATRHYRVAQLCLASSDYLTNSSQACVHAIHLMGTFQLNTTRDGALIFWSMIGLAMRLCVSMGLHRGQLTSRFKVRGSGSPSCILAQSSSFVWADSRLRCVYLPAHLSRRRT